MRCLAVITLLILALAMARPVAAQSFKPDLKPGETAYKQEDYATALKHLRPLAKQGNAKAQAHLANLYLWGHGVTKDYKEAVRLCWYVNISNISYGQFFAKF